MFDANQLTKLQLSLSTPEDVKKHSHGEVKNAETINYRTQKPEVGGLFCERIFGPTKDWECACGKYRGIANKGITCEKCHVQVLRSSVRRERMGHIELAAPVVHIWHFRVTGPRIGRLLDIPYKDLENIIYYNAHIITEVNTELRDQNKAQLQQKFDERIKFFEDELQTKVDERNDLLQKNIDKLPKSATASAKKQLKDSADRQIKKFSKRYEEMIASERETWEAFNSLTKGMLIKDTKLYRKLEFDYFDYFTGEIGADYVEKALHELDLPALAEELKVEIAEHQGQRKLAAQKRLNVVNAFLNSKNSPESMVMRNIPVMPPELRPIIMLDGGRFFVSDLNDLYKRVIIRNNSLKKSLKENSSAIVINQSRRLLQEAVDALIDNGRRGRAVTGSGGRPLKSLSDIFGGTKQKGKVSFKSKTARFRDNLLGKRVDYSGRSVIVVGPDLKMHQCGVPKSMALELFKPFVIKRLVELQISQNPKAAKRMIDRPNNDVWDILEEVIREHPVLLNRAPTLHRLGIQAFEPVLVEGNAIKLHPLACAAFNADFDGDQMAIHVPLSVEAQAEARVLMLGSGNILKPSDGKTITEPSQDMIVGIYYLTRIPKEEEGKIDESKLRIFSSRDEATMAKDLHQIAVNDPIRVRLNINGESKLVTTSLGRTIFNDVLPKGYEYVNRLIGKKELGAIIDDLVAKKYPTIEIDHSLDAMKEFGFKWSTWSGTSIAYSDIMVAPNKGKILEEGESEVAKVNDQYDAGLITEEERHASLVDIWGRRTDEVSQDMRDNFDANTKSTLNAIVKSGARGNWMQVRQLAGMRGLVANTHGDIIARPVKSNYSEGLSVQEYFISSHGARKGVADTAFKTANAGYLTRRIVETGYQTVVNTYDCGTKNGVEYTFSDVNDANKKIRGRRLAEDTQTEKNKYTAGSEITDEMIADFIANNMFTIKARSIYTCKLDRGMCACCYGNSMATGRMVDVGEPVGIIAAQSIGEPGTQLTMRTFHTGGVASKGADLTTQGLPRLIQIIDAVRVDPKKKGMMAMYDGKVEIIMNQNKDYGHEIRVIPNEEGIKVRTYRTSRIQKLVVSDGDKVHAGDRLTEGEFVLQDVLDTKGKLACAMHIRNQIQDVFESQGIDVHDKHIEIIINGMLGFVEITDMGDIAWTKLRPVPEVVFRRENKKAIAEGRTPSKGKQIVVGSKDVGFNVDSWLSAASYLSPITALSNAAVEAKEDKLVGLKENIIVGRVIPAGTGLPVYRKAKASAKSEYLPNFANFDNFDYVDDSDIDFDISAEFSQIDNNFDPTQEIFFSSKPKTEEE
ncbi:MAG: DNA-directed RNA polymerase subunit beta' [Candidatus Ancillula sp.]|jgi:DNA-directed RNA polymerase subunit beta'|nr:DNA-directed RNA polymerase subunit beta' [Candidatus Ancillula sp.]